MDRRRGIRVDRVDVAGLAHRHQAGPAPRDQGARPRPGHRGRAVAAARPGGQDEVLVSAQGLGAVQDDAVALGREAVLVRVDRYGRHARQAEVETTGVFPRAGEAGLFEVRHQEGAEAAIDVERDLVGLGEAGEGRDLVHDAVRVVWR